jgi:hypothetical protein
MIGTSFLDIIFGTRERQPGATSLLAQGTIVPRIIVSFLVWFGSREFLIHQRRRHPAWRLPFQWRKYLWNCLALSCMNWLSKPDTVYANCLMEAWLIVNLLEGK